ncbi:MAG: cytochrome c biogenesis protein ResB [Burkholderiaceae bacterium]|nr:cytochrome c biogenesis protein ResB [Burkholderiaceae bacterium]
MAISTTGIQLQKGPQWLREALELISSMRFSISLLTLIAIVSVIGTVVKQAEPVINYVNQFGPFWAEIFHTIGITSIYNTAWFISIMGFLVLSTSLCVLRNAPRILADMRDFKEKTADRSFAAFAHKAQIDLPLSEKETQQKLSTLLVERGYSLKVTSRQDAGVRYAAKKGLSNRWGYIFAHLAIVMICIGGLLDSGVPLQIAAFIGGKKPLHSNILIKDIPQNAVMGLRNLSFRGNVQVTEGQKISHALLNYKEGTLLQQLPFEIELKKFVVEYYSTGMPKLFASDVVVKDEDGKSFPFRIEVNKPLVHKGIAVYQSSFDDGGSTLHIIAYPLIGDRANSFALTAEVGNSTPLVSPQGASYTIEWSGFRAINVENMDLATEAVMAQTQSQKQKLKDSVANVSGSAAAKKLKNLRNVGPSFSYKLRDKTGQAREYNVYMLPLMLEGQQVFLAGMRQLPSEPFRYVRFPADEQGSLAGYMRFRAALNNPILRERAAERFAMKASSANADKAVRKQLRQSAQRGIDLFAGTQGQEGAKIGGYTAIAEFISGNVKADEQERAADVVLKVVFGVATELLDLAREQEGLPLLKDREASSPFIQQALNAYSDSFFLGAPVLLTLKDFRQVQASVFQVARAPGTFLVYLGALMLIVGTFAMFYIRERRLWAVVQSDRANTTTVRFAMQARKPGLEFEKEFLQLKQAIAAWDKS